MKITRNWVHTANARRQAMAGRSDILELDASPYELDELPGSAALIGAQRSPLTAAEFQRR
jgi:hypothetical protein